MIRSFADRETEKLFERRRSKAVPEPLREKAYAKLLRLDATTNVEEYRIPWSNRLKKLKGDREGQWSIRINDQYRICFRFEDGDAYDVEVSKHYE